MQPLEQKLLNAADAREAPDGSPLDSVSAWAVGVRWPVVIVLLSASIKLIPIGDGKRLNLINPHGGVNFVELDWRWWGALTRARLDSSSQPTPPPPP